MLFDIWKITLELALFIVLKLKSDQYEHVAKTVF